MKRTSIIVNDELSRFVRQTETEKRCHANTTNPLYCCQVLYTRNSYRTVCEEQTRRSSRERTQNARGGVDGPAPSHSKK